jgi:hypothetical protein
MAAFRQIETLFLGALPDLAGRARIRLLEPAVSFDLSRK